MNHNTMAAFNHHYDIGAWSIETVSGVASGVLLHEVTDLHFRSLQVLAEG